MDCSFREGNKRFRYRACGVIIEEGCVLFAKNDIDDYYYSIGGAVMVGETVEDAVKREVFEETGENYEIDKLLFFHENFFTGSGSLEGLDCHEIAFYFLMKPLGKKNLKCNSEATCGVKESLHWLPIEKLHNYKAYPEFFAEKLCDLSENVEHIVTKDIKIQLKNVSVSDAKLIWSMQLKAFKELLEKYQDFDTNPGNDTLEKVISKLKRGDTKYYFIVYKDCCVGVIHIKQIETAIMNLKTLYVLPEYQGLGIAQKTINLIEEMYPNIKEWRLDTILQEKGNCYLYEKMGYERTGEIKNIKDGMDLVYYRKITK